MDDARIRQLTEEVLRQLAAPAEPQSADLESRVAALEARVRDLARPRPSPARGVAGHAHAHPSLHVVQVGSEVAQCVLEPDKPCVKSGQCRSFGH